MDATSRLSTTKAARPGQTHCCLPFQRREVSVCNSNVTENVTDCVNPDSNHPLSHLMMSVFGMHDKERFNILIYSTSPWDGTSYRPRIASMVENCFDVSGWTLKEILRHIQQQEVHIRE